MSERSDLDVRQREGLPPRTGHLAGEAPPPAVTIAERPPAEGPGWTFLADVAAGHKTGFYLDQRENRLGVAELAAGRRVLDLFSYTGGFTVAAAAGGAASVVAVDSSAPALELAARNVERNSAPGGPSTSRTSRPTSSRTCAGCGTEASGSISSSPTRRSWPGRRPSSTGPPGPTRT